MTTSKANAAAASTPVNVLVLYLLSLIPFVDRMPTEPKAALVMLVAGGISWAFVYFAPANSPAS